MKNRRASFTEIEGEKVLSLHQKSEANTVEKELLVRAKASGFNVYRNYLGKWVIKGLIDKKVWILQEQKSNTWLMTFDELSQVSLCTEKSLKALNLLIEYTYEPKY